MCNYLLNSYKKIYSTSVLPDKVKDISYYHISRNANHYFLQFDFSNKKSYRQGFKIHISATMKNYQEILNSVFEFCKNHKVDFKYISNMKELYLNLSGTTNNLWSTGKFITIYPSNYSDFLNLVKDLYALPNFKDKEGICILTDKKYRDSNNIFYRYGMLSKNDNKGIYDKNGQKLYDDYKTLEYKLPYFVKEPFPKKEASNKNKSNNLIFNSYIPIKALHSKAAGSVFLVETNKREKYVLKSAINGYYDTTQSKIEILKNEERNIKRMHHLSFVPNYVDSFYEERNYFLVEEYIKGITVDDYRALTSNDFISNKDTASKFSKIIIDLLSKVDKLHKSNVFLGDISSQNILVNTDKNEVYFIDLDQTIFLGEVDLHKRENNFYGTEGFYDNKIQYLTPLKQDIEQLGYLLISFFCRANMFLKIDNSGQTSIKFFEKFANLNKIPKVFVEAAEQLIKNPDIDLQKMINYLKTSNLDSDSVISTDSFPDNFLNRLIKTDECAKIDNLLISESSDSFVLTYTDDFIYSDKLSKLRLYYLKDESLIQNVFKDFKMRTKLFDKVNILIKEIEKQNKDIKQLSLENIISLIFCCLVIIKDYKLHDSDFFNRIVECTDLILSKYCVRNKNSKLLGFKVKLISKYLSPYLSDGTAGILELLIYFKKYFGINKYDEYIFEMAKNLSKAIMPKNASLYRGLGGIVNALLDYRMAFDDSRYDNTIIKMINCFKYYSINSHGTALMIDQSFGTATTNFKDGNQGIIYVLQKAKHILGK